MTSSLVRYEDWYMTEEGSLALVHMRNLLRINLAGWQRRCKNMLVLHAGGGEFLEELWLAGFDVTAHDDKADNISKCQKLLGEKISYCLSSPEQMPFDDQEFEYAVAIASLEFWQNPDLVMQELARLVCCGCILIFPNKFSLFYLENLWKKRQIPPKQFLDSRSVALLAKKHFDIKNKLWSAVLPWPSFAWARPKSPFSSGKTMSMPLGAFAALRLDFKDLKACPPLFLRTSVPSTTK